MIALQHGTLIIILLITHPHHKHQDLWLGKILTKP